MLLRFENMRTTAGLVHAITTVRFDGIEPFNLAPHIGPGREHAVENRRRLCAELGVDFSCLTAVEQVHKGNVTIVTLELAGRGASDRADALPDCDGSITDLPGVPLMVMSADCPLILIYEPRRRVLVVLHASWRAAVDGIVPHAMTLLTDRFGGDPGQCLAGIGPSAGPCCYEVSEDFVASISRSSDLERFILRDGRSMRFDLWSALRHELARSGIPDANIETMPRCTICDLDFFSYRRQGPDTARFALIAAMNGLAGHR